MEGSETESSDDDFSKFSQSVSVPNVEKLELALNDTRDTKSLDDGELSDNESHSEWRVGGKIIDYIKSSCLSFSSSCSSFA